MNKENHQETAYRAKKSSAIIFAVFLCFLLIVAAAVCAWSSQHTFSKSKWDMDRENRYKIVHNMLSKHQLIGMRESDVIQLLGEEDSNQASFKISKRYFPPDATLVYYMGVHYMDSNWLILSIHDGVVTEYCIDIT